MDSNDIDATSYFFQEATSELTNCRTLTEILTKFGFSKDDIIDRRDTVKMYKNFKREMEREIERCARSGDYDSAKQMRARLTCLRAEFDNLQTSSVQKVITDQKDIFERASGELFRHILKEQGQQRVRVQRECEVMKEDQRLAHEIERENLEIAISRIPRPKIKYSKRLIELMKAESELINLNQYEDANKVRLMINRILPAHEQRFYSAFEESIRQRRERLLAKQAVEVTQLEEKLKAITWDDIRHRESESSIATQRIVNLVKDMTHSHALETKLKPEMSVLPSKLWEKRTGHVATSALFRGQQLLGAVRVAQTSKVSGGLGKSSNNATKNIFAESLVDRHQFVGQPLDGTITLR